MNAPFDLVEVEPGRRLHGLVEGPAEAPWVVFDHGAFGTYADGWWIKEVLKADHRVVFYGQAGMDWSDPTPEGALNAPARFIGDAIDLPRERRTQKAVPVSPDPALGRRSGRSDCD
jgi:pimeloyl-ACP methyl ester carboxylesterase